MDWSLLQQTRDWMNEEASRKKERSEKESVLLGASRDRSQRAPRIEPQRGWRVLGLFGLLLAVIGLVDVLLYLYPPAFDSAEWEFGTMTAILSGLPLPSIGFGALAAWVLVQGGRKTRVAVSLALFAMGILVAAAYLLFLLNVPLALSASEGPQGAVITRAIIRTTVMGAGFGAAYLVGGMVMVRTLSGKEG